MPRKITAELARAYMARGDATGWFEDLYRRAGGNDGAVPWADGHAHILLQSWLEGQEFARLRALDVGCGLGDNAEALAVAGMQVSAIDISPTAIEWAQKRFPHSLVNYRAADLFNLPDDWAGRFVFINEIYTLQALPESVRQMAMTAIARLLAPGGHMLVICRGREEHQHSDGPPWALTKAEIMAFEAHGLKCQSFERFDAYDDSSWPRFRFVFTA